MSNENNANISDEKTAAAVLKEYEISALDTVLIQGGTIKTVWKVLTDKGPLCLKRLRQTIDKALFSVNAQIYIKSLGGNVPGVILNKNGEGITRFNNQLFVMYEWLGGADLDFNRPEDFKKALGGLARFHAYSKGYIPPENARTSTKLGKWPEQYESMLNKLSTWLSIAKANASQQHYSEYLRLTPPIIDIGRMVLEAIMASAYEELTAEGSNSIVLCHQDYGRGNALLTDKGVYVLDLDGVTYDLPARDLRKIIGKTAENRNRWELETINEITGWYEESFPLLGKEKRLLYVDLLFPHWYYGLVKNQFQSGKTLKASEIEKIAKLELSKVPIIKTLLMKE